MSTRENVLLKIAQGAPIQETGIPTSGNPLLEIAKGNVGFSHARAPEPDVGVVGAFKAGVKTGVLEPFRVFGIDPESHLNIDETSEKVSNFIGSMVGMGISFVPFAGTTGLVLKGVGLTARLGEGTALYHFVRNTIAGATQFAGGSENLEEVPGNLVKGVAFGAAIEGLFLANAMRGRKAGIGKLFDDGSPIPDNPVDPSNLAKEIAISPSEASSPSTNLTVVRGLTAHETARPELEVKGLEINIPGTELNPPEIIPSTPLDISVSTELPTRFRTLESQEGHKVEFLFNNVRSAEPLSYEQILTEMTKVSDTTVSIPDIANANSLIEYAKGRLPTTAQILKRSYITGIGELNEVLIHNPLDPSDALSPKQIAQWQAGGFPENMQVVYKGKDYIVTGLPVSEGRIQLRSVDRPGVVFAPKVNEVSKPIMTKFHSETPRRLEILRKAIEESESDIGFAITDSTGEKIRRGYINTRNFEEVQDFQEFLSKYKAGLSAIKANTQEEAIAEYAKLRGIQGLVFMDEGIPMGVRIFDQEAIRVGPSRLNSGITPDIGDVVFGKGDEIIGINSLSLSSKNNIIGALMKQGLPEKEIKSLIDLHSAQFQKRLTDLMDDEFKAIKNVSEAQYGGCI